MVKKINNFDFLDRICSKMYFLPITDQMNTIIEFSIFALVKAPSFILTTQFWLFGPNFLKKEISSPKENVTIKFNAVKLI